MLVVLDFILLLCLLVGSSNGFLLPASNEKRLHFHTSQPILRINRGLYMNLADGVEINFDVDSENNKIVNNENIADNININTNNNANSNSNGNSDTNILSPIVAKFLLYKLRLMRWYKRTSRLDRIGLMSSLLVLVAVVGRITNAPKVMVEQVPKGFLPTLFTLFKQNKQTVLSSKENLQSNINRNSIMNFINNVLINKSGKEILESTGKCICSVCVCVFVL